MTDYDNKPALFNWPAVTQGDSFRALQFNASGTTAALARVRCKIKNADGDTLLTLDSDATGATIDTATAGAWQYTLGPITAAQTTTLGTGFLSYDIETIDDDDIVETHFKGTWEILPQVTD